MRSIEVPQYFVQGEVWVDPARTALVVIDMQNDFVKQGGGLLVPDAEATVPAAGSWTRRRRYSCRRGSGGVNRFPFGDGIVRARRFANKGRPPHGTGGLRWDDPIAR
jgi:hypothetical protein